MIRGLDPSAASYRAAFQAAPDLYLLLATDFTILDASDAYLRAASRQRAEVEGLSVFAVFPEDAETHLHQGHANLRRSLERALATRAPDRMPLQKYNVRGPDTGFEERIWSPLNTPVLGADGSVLALLHRVEDVTSAVRREDGQVPREEQERFLVWERKTVEQALRLSETKVRRIYDSGMIGLLFWDVDGRIEDANDAFLDLLGYTREDLAQGKLSWRALTPPEFAPVDERALEQVAREGRSAPFEKEYLSKDGRRVPVYVGAARLGEEANHGVAFVLDITARKRAEEERQRLLERDLKAQEFAERLLGIVGHDLRNPLSAVITSASTLGRHLNEPDQQKRVRQILSSAGRMEAIISNLLDYTRARSGALPLVRRRIDAHEVCRRTVREVQVSHPERALVVQAQGDATGDFDPDRLEQVVSNLVANAVKYGAKGEPVMVVTWGEKTMWTLQVSNGGDPIPPQILPRLFSPFERGPQSEATVKQSLGLGLYIASEVVRAHGGTISVSSSAGHRTVFTVRLPRYEGGGSPQAGGGGAVEGGPTEGSR